MPDILQELKKNDELIEKKVNRAITLAGLALVVSGLAFLFSIMR